MNDLQEMVDAYEGMRDRMLSDAEALEKRSFTLRSERNGTMVDISDEWAATLRRRAQELDNIVTACRDLKLVPGR